MTSDVVTGAPTRLARLAAAWRVRGAVPAAAVLVAAAAVVVATSSGGNTPHARARSTAALSGAGGLLADDPVPAWGSYPAVVVTPDDRHGDAPNPFVVVAGNTDFMYSSQGNVYQPNVPVRTSHDLLHWSVATDALPLLPAWAEAGFTWSPDVHLIGGRYVMWFSALVKGLTNPTAADNGIECIGWATSPTPGGPFRADPGAFAPVCQADRYGSIDPHLFEAPDGTMWLYWKSDDNADVSADTRSTIWVQRLAPDGTDLLGNPAPLISADQPFEGRIVEDGQMVYAAGTFWFFYSANWYNQPVYSIALARCSGPVGPCTKLGVWLNANAQGAGTGESTVFADAHGRWWIAYAPWAADGRTYTPRPVALARLGFLPSGPYLAAP